MKIVTVVGARPQFIKAATVSRACAEMGVHEVLVHTGQHYDANMSDVFFQELEIPEPSYHLGIGGGPHGAMTGRQLEKIEQLLLVEKPDWLLVYGDTNSTLAGALAAAKLRIPIAHVEAGLRSFNRAMPEEINRVLTDHLSQLLFVPTVCAENNLRREGIIGEGVALVGDVMYDATLFYKPKAKKPQWFDDLGMSEGRYVLCTIHRAENTDDPVKLTGIMKGLGRSGLPVLIPMHPRTQNAVRGAGIEIPANVKLVLPVGYLEMMWLEMFSSLIATDSGGVQKEAYFHGKRCVTLRSETEWVELIEVGANVLVGTCANRISSALLDNKPLELANLDDLYGSGHAASKIVQAIIGD